MMLPAFFDSVFYLHLCFSSHYVCWAFKSSTSGTCPPQFALTTCPGDITYTCVLNSSAPLGVVTVWSGSAFQCPPANHISLTQKALGTTHSTLSLWWPSTVLEPAMQYNTIEEHVRSCLLCGSCKYISYYALIVCWTNQMRETEKAISLVSKHSLYIYSTMQCRVYQIYSLSHNVAVWRSAIWGAYWAGSLWSVHWWYTHHVSFQSVDVSDSNATSLRSQW